MKRRSLVLTDDTARHPFLASLPPFVRLGTAPILLRRPNWITMQSVRDFLLAYCACFVMVSTFIA